MAIDSTSKDQTITSPIGAGTEAAAVRVTVATDSTGVLTVDDGGANLSVDWGGTVPPIGAGTEAAALRVTLATDSTGTLTVDNAGTFVVQEDGAALTALQKLDNIAHSGSDVALVEHVPISGQLDDTATTTVTENQIAPVRINSARALHVDGSGVTQPVSAASLPLPTGAATAANQLPDGHNVTVDNAAGASAVNIQDGGNTITVDGTVDLGTAAVTNAGTFAVQEDGAALTALQKLDNIAHSGSDVALSEHVPISGQLDDTATTTVTENQIAPVRINANRALHVDGSGVTQPVSGTVTVTHPALGGGTEAGAQRVTLANDSTGTLTVDNAGTFVVQEDGAALTALQLIDDPVFADDAAFTLTSSKAMVSGAIRDDSLTTLTAVEGDVVPLRVGSTGALHVTGGGGGTEYTQDVAHTDPATASTLLIPRDDALSTQETTDGDWTLPRANARGALWVEIDGTNALNVSAATVTVAGTGTLAVQEDGAALTALQLIDDAVYADDAPFTLASSKAMAAGAIRDDGLTTLTAAEGDVVPLRVGSTGALHVTGGGGGTEYTQDVAHTDPATASTFLMARDDALSTQETADGDWTLPRANARGAQWVELDPTNSHPITWDGTAPPIGAGTEAAALRVTVATDSTGVLTVDNAGTFATQIDGAALTALQKIDNIAHSGSDVALVEHVPISGQLDDTATTTVTENQIAPVRINSARALHVDGSGVTQPVSGTVTANAGTGTMTVDLGANNDVTATGSVADDATTPGNPVMIGGSAKETDGTDPGSVSAEDDVTRVITDRNRRLLVNTAHPNMWSVAENHSTAQTNNALKAAPGAGLSLYITDVVVSNGATAGNIKFVEDTGGTPVDVIEVMYFAVNGGAALHFQTPIRITANKDFGFTSVTSTTHSITVSGYTAP